MRATLLTICFGAVLIGCSTLPEAKYEQWDFPKKGVYFGVPDRPYERVAPLRTKVNFATLSLKHDETQVCRNYFNKAASILLRMAEERGADAVIDVKSVVFMMDGKSKAFPGPECFDDGSEGQVLAQGIAIKWKKSP